MKTINYKRILLITMTFFAFIGTSIADENRSNILVSVGSHHTGTYDYNNETIGLGYEEEVDDENNLWVGAATYNNSYNKTSTMVFVTKRAEALSFGSFTPHLSVGIANNYEDDRRNINGLLPFAMTGGDYEINEDISIRVNTTALFTAIVGGDTLTNFMLVFKYN